MPCPFQPGEWSWRKIRSGHNPILLCTQFSGDGLLVFTLFLDAKRKNKSEPPFFTLRIEEARLPHFCVQVALFDEVCRVPRSQTASHGHTALFSLTFSQWPSFPHQNVDFKFFHDAISNRCRTSLVFWKIFFSTSSMEQCSYFRLGNFMSLPLPHLWKAGYLSYNTLLPSTCSLNPDKHHISHVLNMF